MLQGLKRCFYCLAIENLSGGPWHNSQYIRHFQLKTPHKERSSRTPSCQVGPQDILSQEFCTVEVADLLWRKQILWEQSTWQICECILEQTERAICLNTFSEINGALILAYALNTWYFIYQYHAQIVKTSKYTRDGKNAKHFHINSGYIQLFLEMVHFIHLTITVRQ